MSETADEIVEERVYTVPFGKKIYGRGIPRKKRTPRAVRYLRQFISKHMRSDDVSFDPLVNEKMWARGIQYPPRRIRIRAAKTEDDHVTIYLE